ncbi:hypothetical protein ACJROX_12635 [Pseudalkalibacillus sp. A8]|uniref:cucumopine synthase-related protein n=1 Tax=Pseudalkalibacillus sp. A8 TaxID=3382641 RepID=UPI0038B436C6
MQDNITSLKQEIEKEINKIWLKEPEDIYALSKGYLPSGAGIYDQYFSVLVMVAGEVRSLAIHTFADLLEFARDEEFQMSHLKKMVKRMLKIDCGVIEYFGLSIYGRILNRYNNIVDEFNDKEQFIEITQLMFTLTNRYQMWLHQIFPWRVSVFYKQIHPEEYKKIYENLRSL